MKVTCRSLLIVSAMMATFAMSAHSQVRSGSSKILGTAMRGHEAEADIYRQHAADRSRIIYYYSQTQVPLPSSEVKAHVNSIRPKCGCRKLSNPAEYLNQIPLFPYCSAFSRPIK